MRGITSSAVLVVGALSLVACTGSAPRQITSNGASLQAAHEALTEGEAGTSLAIAHGILASQPRNVAALAQAGDAEAALGDRLAADVSYKHALALAPRDVHARLGLGKLQIRDDLRAAETSFRTVVADAPHDIFALNDLGDVLDLQERHGEAQRFYATALIADPDRMGTRVNMALSLALSGQPEHAEQLMRDVATSATASRRVRLDLAAAQVMAGHDRDAAETLGSDLSPAETISAIQGLHQLRIVQPATAVTQGLSILR